MSSSLVATISKNNRIYKTHKNNNKFKDLKSETSTTKTNTCTTFKPNIQTKSVTDFDGTTSIATVLLPVFTMPSPAIVLKLNTLHSTYVYSHIEFNAFRTITKPKFCIYLLILLGVIAARSSHAIPVPTTGSRLILHTQQYQQQRHQQLLQLQRSLVQPTPRRHHLHHRSVRNMSQTGQTNVDITNGKEIGEKCSILTERSRKNIIEAKKQADATFEQLYKRLPDYFEAEHNDTPTNFYAQWKIHSLGLQHPYAQHLQKNNLRDFDKMLEDLTSDKIHLWKKQLTLEVLEIEFQNIFQTLKVLRNVYNEVEEKRANNTRLCHNYRRGNETEGKANERCEKTKTFFKDVIGYLNQDQTKVKKLGISEDKIPVSYNHNLDHLLSHLFLEHLAIMKYLSAVYKYILETCTVATQ